MTKIPYSFRLMSVYYVHMKNLKELLGNSGYGLNNVLDVLKIPYESIDEDHAEIISSITNINEFKIREAISKDFHERCNEELKKCN